MGIPVEVAKDYGKVQENYKGSMGMEKAYINARRWLVTSFSNFDMGLGKMEDIFQAFERYGSFRGDYLRPCMTTTWPWPNWTNPPAPYLKQSAGGRQTRERHHPEPGHPARERPGPRKNQIAVSPLPDQTNQGRPPGLPFFIPFAVKWGNKVRQPVLTQAYTKLRSTTSKKNLDP